MTSLYTSQNTEETSSFNIKACFFGNYFQYALSEINEGIIYYLDNHLSIIEKIIYSMENNKDWASTHINNYLKHPLLQNDDLVTQNYQEKTPLLSNLISKCNQISNRNQTEQAKEKERKEEIKKTIKNQDFQAEVNLYRSHLKEKYFSDLLECTYKKISCNHNLDTHIKDFTYCVPLLANILYFAGYSTLDISNKISGIICNEVEDIPFSNDLKGSKMFDEEEDISSLGFKERFFCLENLIKNSPETINFYFRVYNISAPEEEFEYIYDKVQFKSNYDKSITSIVQKNFERGKRGKNNPNAFTQFFQGGKYLIAHVKLNYRSRDIAVQDAIDMIRYELKYLNCLLEANGVVDTFSYTYSSNSEYLGAKFGQFGDPDYKIRERDIKGLNRSNVHVFLNNISNNAKDYVINRERLFIDAFTTPKSGKLIAKYWEYLESMFFKNFRDNLARILLVDSSNLRKRKLLEYILRKVEHPHNSFDSTVITFDEQRRICKLFSESKFDEFLIEVREKFNIPFLNFLIQNYFEIGSSVKVDIGWNEYRAIFDEASEIRNLYVHNGLSNPKAVEKLDLVFPYLVNRIRQLILEAIKNNEAETFDEIFKTLTERSEIANKL